MSPRVERALSDPKKDDDDWLKREAYPMLRDLLNAVKQMGTIPWNLVHVNGGESLNTAYPPFGPGATMTTLSMNANEIYATPFIAPGRGGTIDQLLFEVQSNGGAGDGARIGVYSNESESILYPTDLRYGSDEIATTSNAVFTQDVSIELQPGELIWLALIRNSNTNITVRAFDVGGSGILGAPLTMGAVGGNSGLTVSYTYAALPDTFPSAAAYSTTGSPYILSRFSA